MNPTGFDTVKDSIEKIGASVRFGYPWLLRPFLRGFIGITLGRTIFLAPQILEQGEELLERTLRHELVHLQQIQRMGRLSFYWQYLREYARLRLAGKTHIEAYDGISFEQEARQEAGEKGTL